MDKMCLNSKKLISTRKMKMRASDIQHKIYFSVNLCGVSLRILHLTNMEDFYYNQGFVK